VLLLAWSVTAAWAGLQEARRLPIDPMAQLDAEFRPFAGLLPATGTVGYLEQFDNAGTDDAQRMHYAAQYSLAPLVVERRTGAEFLIVARGTERPGGDERLTGYRQIAYLPGDHRLFRRTP